MSRLPQPTTSHLQAPEAHISQPIKKRKHEVPRVPQTPVYGDTWDAERDQMPPPTPSDLATTSMLGRVVDPNESVHPISETLVSISEQQRRSTDFASEQLNPGDVGVGAGDPRHNSTQSQDQHDPQARYTAPLNISTQTPPTPQTRPGTVPSTPLDRSGTDLSTSYQIPPGPFPEQSQTRPPILSQQGHLISPALGDAQLAPLTQQQSQPIPSISQRQSVLLIPQEKVQPDPSIAGQQANTLASSYNTREPVLTNYFFTPLRLRNVPLTSS